MTSIRPASAHPVPPAIAALLEEDNEGQLEPENSVVMAQKLSHHRSSLAVRPRVVVAEPATVAVERWWAALALALDSSGLGPPRLVRPSPTTFILLPLPDTLPFTGAIPQIQAQSCADGRQLRAGTAAQEGGADGPRLSGRPAGAAGAVWLKCAACAHIMHTRFGYRECQAGNTG